MSDDEQPSDTMRRRVDKGRWKLWLLMDANRWLVAGLLLVGVFLALVALGVADPSPLENYIGPGDDPVDTTFQGFISAIITGVTLVVTINQLVLSQELGPLGDQRERMDGAIDFRADVETWLDDHTSPPDPASFLEAIIDGIQTYANELEDAVSDDRDEEFRDQVRNYVDSLTENARQVGEALDGAQFGTFDVLFVALNFNYSWKIYEARRLRNANADAIDEETGDALDDVIQVLEFFGPAREHFKTLYFQWELVNLSRAMLYLSVPAIIVTVAMIVYFDARAVPGSTLGISNDVLTVSLATTIALAPFLVLVSFILRIATVAKRTLAIGPFILRETTRSDDIDWEQ